MKATCSDRWALGELDRVVGADALASSPIKWRRLQHRPFRPPEWDYLYSLNPTTRRRLIGARYMRLGAMQPDQLAELIVPRVAGVETVDAAMEWYVNTCLVAIAERRVLAHRRRHLAVARRNGHLTYYAYRNELAKAAGYTSLYDMRMRRGWGDGRNDNYDHDWRSWSDYLKSVRSG